MAIINQGPGLTPDGNQGPLLYRNFTDKETKEAIFVISNIKSPGPDGYNSGFYKAT